MPLYEYECDACGHRFELIQKFSDPPASTCPKCGGTVHKLISAPAFQLKGTGWYITDYAKKDSGGAAGGGSSSRDNEKTDKAGEKAEKTEKAEKAGNVEKAGKADASEKSSGSTEKSSTPPPSTPAKSETKP